MWLCFLERGTERETDGVSAGSPQVLSLRTMLSSVVR